MKLTIVLTVYNKEPFLHRAFKHLLNQEGVNHDDYEVLVVNDGSTDGSSAIISEFAHSNKGVRVLTQENQGLSMARNNGVVSAKGEYVWFVDADDTISPLSVKFIVGATKEIPDVIPIYAKTDGIERVRNAIRPDIKNGKEIIIEGHWQQCGVFYVYRKSFLIEKSLRFMPGVYHEDAEFTPRMLYVAKKVKVVPEVLYTVYRDPYSITQVPRAKRAFDYIIVADSLSRFLVECGEEGSPIGKAIDEYTAQDINNAFYVIVQNSKDEQKKLNEVYYERRELLNRVLWNTIKLKYRVEALLFCLFPKYYVQVYKLMKCIG